MESGHKTRKKDFESNIDGRGRKWSADFREPLALTPDWLGRNCISYLQLFSRYPFFVPFNDFSETTRTWLNIYVFRHLTLTSTSCLRLSCLLYVMLKFGLVAPTGGFNFPKNIIGVVRPAGWLWKKLTVKIQEKQHTRTVNIRSLQARFIFIHVTVISKDDS